MGDAIAPLEDDDAEAPTPILAQIPGSSFAAGFSFNYAGAPSTTALTPPDGESAPGQGGSSIASQGRGPNVATGTDTMVDVKPALVPSADAPDPSTSSSNIASGDVYGGSVLGSSKHNI